MGFILPLHIGILIATVALILYTDHLGFQYLRGTKETLNSFAMRRFHRLIWAGLIGMITTGFLMFWPAREAYFSYTPFFIKMSFVALLVINAFFIGHLQPLASTRPFALLTPAEKRKLLISGALSTVGWAGAILMGLIYFG